MYLFKVKNTQVQMKIKPFLKWAGGKTKLLPEIRKHIPDNFGDYHEPFVGGGAVFLDLLSRGILRGKKVYISDINENLINCYRVIQQDVQSLITELEKQEYKNTKEQYYTNRKEFNRLKKLNSPETNIQRASLFIYLNKTGFNGMYRENKSGEYNIPYGKMTVKDLGCNIAPLLTEISRLIRDCDCHFYCRDYSVSLELVGLFDFVYIDSPYDNTFSDYDKSCFTRKNQELLASKLKQLECKVLVSNSNTDFTRELYKDYHLYIVSSRYSIGANSSSRGMFSEMLVKFV